MLLADDTARQVTAKELAAYRFCGGRNNEPALCEAIRLAKANGNGPIVWPRQSIAQARASNLALSCSLVTLAPTI